MAAHSSILAWKTLWTEEPASPWGPKESDTTEQVSTHTHKIIYIYIPPGEGQGGAWVQPRQDPGGTLRTNGVSEREDT